MEQEELQRTVTKQQRQIENLQRQIRYYSSLIEVSNYLSSTLDLHQLVSGVLETSQRIMNSEASNLMLLNEETGLLECKVALGEVGDKLQNAFTLEMGQGIAGWVAQHGQPVIVPDVTQDDRFYQGVDARTGFVTKSVLCAPLIVQDKVIGVAQVINRTDGQSFTEEDMQIFQVFCRGVAVSVENIKMHQRLLDSQRYQQQLEMASIIQQGFLPRSFTLSDNRKYEIAAQNLPASLVGGDLYDCIELQAGLLGLTIGDVSGKGVPAALYMARLLSDFRFHTQQIEQPAAMIKTLNQLLVERSQRGMFVTMIYLTFDVNQGVIQYVNAGHLPPILYRRPSREIIILEGARGIPLGIMPNAEYNEESLSLREGDTLVFCTDGILDAKNASGEHFNRDNLLAIIQKPWKTAEDLIKIIFKAIRRYAGEERQFDDITTMVLTWH